MPNLRERPVNLKLMCIIRYQIDPYQKEAFQTYARTFGTSSFLGLGAICSATSFRRLELLTSAGE